MKDLSEHVGTLPYASELFGIYQPLLGWKSQITAKRVDQARQRAYLAVATKVLNQVRAPVTVRTDDDGEGHDGHNVLWDRFINARFSVEGLKPLDLERGIQPFLSASIDSGVARLLRARLGDEPPRDWQAYVNPDHLTELLDRLRQMLTEPERLEDQPEVASYVNSFVASFGVQERPTILRALFDKESRIAGYLIFLAQHAPSQLTALFFRMPRSDILKLATFSDPLLNFGDNAYQAILSPVGIIHLFREYFFEFDSFLGPPVGHVWISPGGTVELIEVNTRKVFTERTFEMATETIQRSETELTTQDDIADAVKEENNTNVKFGFTNTATYTTPVTPVFQDSATASLSLDHAKSTSRETTHKVMRRQSEKLSSEIKRNFKTTFRTSTEITDTTSKRYVIQNTTKRLVNYELRRKMRKVGVQVQDIGVQLCWHTFVDDPGRELGISKLVHLGEKPDMSGLVPPEAPANATDETQEINFPIPFVPTDDHEDNEQSYTHGTETDVEDVGDVTEHIQADFPQSAMFTKPGYQLTGVRLEAVGFDAKVSAPTDKIASDEGSSKGSFVAHLDFVNWDGAKEFTVKGILTWSPSADLNQKLQGAYDKAVEKFNAESARRYKEAFIKAARERIKLASKIQARPAEDLREEERTVIYRKLISQLMSVAPNESKHVISELIRSIFDVDKMLYFVAPEWWIPRLHQSTQQLGEEVKPPSDGNPGPATTTASAGPITVQAAAKTSMSAIYVGSMLKVSERPYLVAAPQPTPIPAANLVDWGGAKEYGRDNYYITEDSDPAKLGSSLGWLMQLDGDNMRNALLNAPWVKAVIPIRIGKEREAINWLRKAHVEGEEGLDAKYSASPDDPPELQSTPDHEVTILEALTFLADKIKAFDQNSRSPVLPNPAEPEDPRNHFAGSMPTEAVFESGFYPLKGGTRFNQDGTEQPIFTQWMEILPTDQIAALEVEYDPKTLQVKVAPQPAREDEPDDDDDD